MTAETAHAEPRTPGEYALAYAGIGWAVVPLHWIDNGHCSCGRADCPSPGKHPYSLVARHGAHDASKDPATIARWWAQHPRMAVGIATGAASGFVVVDIDPRNGGDITWGALCDRNGGEPDTAQARTGGGGRHLLFQHDAERVMRSPGKGIDVKGDGGLIVVEPSMHMSGKQYSWDTEADPLTGGVIAPAPSWLSQPRAADVVTAGRDASGAPVSRAVGFIPPQQAADVRAALRYLDADSYEVWVQVGMALHSTDATEAFPIWCEWASSSTMYKESEHRQKWASFGQRSLGLHIESIFWWARDAGWPGSVPIAIPAEQVTLAAPAPVQMEQPAGLLELPGALGAFVRYVNATAPRPQPAFAVGAAIALGATVCGRRYRTTRNNFSSLYLVHVGKSGSGKEHARTVIDAALTAADWPQLIGRSGFSSDSAVVSTLLQQPSQITIMDEIGALLGNIQAEGAYHERSAVKALVEAWGNLHGTMRPKALSTLSATRDQIDAQLKQVVHNPALTLLGMTTPRTFYGALTEQSIEGGFLSRLLVIETDIGRQPRGTIAPAEVPAQTVDWIKAVRTHQASRGNLAGVDAGADAKPTLTEIPIDAAACALFDAYDLECIASADELEQEGMAELEVRSVEKAQRVAMILAVSSDPFAPTIGRFEAQWAIDFVRHWTARTVRAVRENMHGGKFAQWQAEVRRVITKSGQKGRTESELARYSRTFDNLEPRQRRTVLDALASRGSIALVEIKTIAGRKRAAWVATVESVDSGDN